MSAPRDPNTVQPEATPPVAAEAVDPRLMKPNDPATSCAAALPEEVEEALRRFSWSFPVYMESLPAAAGAEAALRAAISSALGRLTAERDEERRARIRWTTDCEAAETSAARWKSIARVFRRIVKRFRRSLPRAESRASAAEARIAEVERACDMPLDMIATTLDAHRKTANEDHDRASAAAAALRVLVAAKDRKDAGLKDAEYERLRDDGWARARAFLDGDTD